MIWLTKALASSVVRLFLIFLLGGAVVFGVGKCRDNRIVEDAKLRATNDSLERAEMVESAILYRTDTVTDTKIEYRTQLVERILRDAGPTVKREDLISVANACTEVEKSCATQRAAAQSLINNLNAQIAVRDDIISKKPPRLSVFTEVLYDVLNKEPVGRVGVDFRVGGPLSVSGAVDGTSREGKGEVRALAGIRYTFQ